jgi:hypothetical protein
MKLKGLKKRLKALKPIETQKDLPLWCKEYASTLTPERWQAIEKALNQFKQGITADTEALSGDDRDFYEKVIEASKEGIVEL